MKLSLSKEELMTPNSHLKLLECMVFMTSWLTVTIQKNLFPYRYINIFLCDSLSDCYCLIIYDSFPVINYSKPGKIFVSDLYYS